MVVELQLISLLGCSRAAESLDWCSAGEARRAQNISLPRRRVQFLSGRWLARQMLSEHYGGEPSDWQLCCESGCAPVVERGPTRASVSLAHRVDVVACAVSDIPIGIDVEVELPRASQDADGRAEIMLSPTELRSYARTAPSGRAALLRALWVLKEAWTKARGMSLELSLLPRISAVLVTPAAANARLWVAGKVTLGLVCQHRGALAHINVTGLPVSEGAQYWRVEMD